MPIVSFLICLLQSGFLLNVDVTAFSYPGQNDVRCYSWMHSPSFTNCDVFYRFSRDNMACKTSTRRCMPGMQSCYRNNIIQMYKPKHISLSELTSQEKRKARDDILEGGNEKLIKQLLSQVPLSTVFKRDETRRLEPVKDLRRYPERTVRTGIADVEENVVDDTEETDVEEPTHINKIRASNFVLHKGDVHLILASQHVSQARSRGHYKVKMRNLINNKEISHSFADGTKLSVITPNKVSCTYKGVDERSGDHRFQSEGFEILVPKNSSLEKLKYLKLELKVTLSRWRGQIIGLLVPHQIQYKVTDVNPGNYAATLENGMVVLVPSYIKRGDSVDINTAKGEFLRRSIIG